MSRTRQESSASAAEPTGTEPGKHNAPRGRRISTWAFSAALLITFAFGAWFTGVEPATANDMSRVFLNGRPVPVRFNDGDSFRIFAGEYSGSQCRLFGFNSLESFGPAHQWGTWHPYELYINAKLATVNGRRGTWHCFTSGERDTYGRLLVECPDLIVDDLRRGYAHAYEVNDRPARPEYLRAQHEAMRAGRGMWAHGIPRFITTSLHSASEDPSRENHYDRLISTLDGHSQSRVHHDNYDECQWVCEEETALGEGQAEAVARSLRDDPGLAPLLSEWTNIHLMEFVTRFATTGNLPEYLTGSSRDPILAQLQAAREAGALGTRTQRGSCMLYVDFTRRYGDDRASCLAGHGTLPADLPDQWHAAH